MTEFGKLATDPAGTRDAIHVATIVVTATDRLEPGDLCNKHGGVDPPHVGVVDPFLPREVQPGMAFWLFLFPGTITTLRHAWVHPDWDEIPPTPPPPSLTEAELAAVRQRFVDMIRDRPPVI